MATLAENIKNYRKQAKLTQKELAEKLNIAPTAVSAWELGRNKPLMDNIEHMSLLFGIKKSVLLGDDLPTTPTSAPDELVTAINDKVVQLTTDRKKNVLRFSESQLEAQEQTKVINIHEKQAQYDTKKRISLPVPGEASAGTGVWAEDQDREHSFRADDLPDEDSYDTIALVNGTSMEPKLHHGDYLFIKHTPSVDANQIGIFQVNGENYVKKLRLDTSTYQPYLESLNPAHPNIYLHETDTIRTIGEVVDIYRES